MTVTAERAPWLSPRILTTLMLVFLAGAATGALSMRLIHHPAPVNAAPPREVVLDRFRTELGLDGAQVQKLSLLLDDYGQYYESLQEQLDDLRATGKTRIMQILNPQQRAKFERMMNDLAPANRIGWSRNHIARHRSAPCKSSIGSTRRRCARHARRRMAA